MIDTTNLNIEQVVEKLLSYVQKNNELNTPKNLVLACFNGAAALVFHLVF